MALNLKKNEKSLNEAWDWLKLSNKVGKWVVFGYEGKSFNLEHAGSGDGGLEELSEELSDGRIMYGAVCVEDPNSGLPKIVFIVWQGLGVPEIVRGKCAVHAESILNFFKGYHVNITARGEADIDETVVLEKVKKCSGANYGVHKEKQKPPEKPSHPVASYQKIDPSKELSFTEREKFWEKDAQDSTISQTEKPSVLRAQEVKASKSAVETFKMMENDRLRREKELEEEQNRKREIIKSNIKSSSSEPEPAVIPQTKEQEIKVLPSGKASAFKAMFEQKIDQQATQIKPQPVRTGKKWEPVQTKPVPSSVPQMQPQSYYDETSIRSGRFDDSSPTLPPIQPRPFDGLSSAPPPIQPRPFDDSSSAPPPIQPRPFDDLSSAPPPIQPRPFDDLGSTPPPIQSRPTYNASYEPPPAIIPRVQEQEPEPTLPTRATEVQTFTVIALYDYDASDETEISFKVGERITDVVKDDDEWWTGTNQKGERGQLPYNFVVLEGTREADEVLQLLAEEVEKIDITQPIGRAKVLYSYDAADNDELSVTENEIISILEKRDDGWWIAQNSKGETGLVPCNFVEE